MILPEPQPGVQRRSAPRSFSTKSAFQMVVLFLLSVVLSTGCVSKEQFASEKVRGLNFQRLLAQEEKRASKLDAQLAQKDKEIEELNTQLKKTKDNIAALESQNRDLTVAYNALKKQSHRQQEQEPVPDTPALSQDPGTSQDKPLSESSLSDPFMSEEELMKMLDKGKTK